MRSLKVSLFLGLGLLAVLFAFSTGQAQVLVPASQEAKPSPKPPTAVEARKAKTGCKKLYTRKMFHSAARSTYKIPSKAAKRRKLAKIVRCQRSEKSERIVRKHLKNYKRSYARRVYIHRITPFVGPDGRRWAIPWPIVSCESKGYFGAYNKNYEPHGPGSGPGGAYQIIRSTWQANGGVGVARYASQFDQHRVAHNIWTGAGRSQWEC